MTPVKLTKNINTKYFAPHGGFMGLLPAPQRVKGYIDILLTQRL